MWWWIIGHDTSAELAERNTYLHVVRMQLAGCVMSNAVFQRHQQRVHILESFELGLIDLVDDATKTRIKRCRLDYERFTVSLTSEQYYIAIPFA